MIRACFVLGLTDAAGASLWPAYSYIRCLVAGIVHVHEYESSPSGRVCSGGQTGIVN